ncbi:MAG: hypothetical protein LBM70_05955 [Victivallales bacterium]|jgi:hypothetical protein|nr:hypothetical protein [Victivallales bacterium]
MPKEKSNAVKSFRPMPFWAWNGDLSPERLTIQICQMKEMGFGGFFMHSRFGLSTEYLGKRWFECVKRCIEEAVSLGMDPFLYDEDRWPSGYAGGMLTTAHPEYTQCGIDYEFCEIAGAGNHDIGYFAVKFKDDTIVGYRRIELDGKLQKDERFCRVFEVLAPVDDSLNASSYIDMLNPAAVKEFIKLTHECYLQKLGKDFSHVAGIFTDEPTYNNFRGKLPWSKLLPERFFEVYHTRIEESLPELFFEIDGVSTSKLRLDFYNLITAEFVNAFSRQVGDWCRANGIALVGHILGEDDLFAQTQAVGSAMRHYEYMDIPGIDVLSEHWNLYLAAKQCSSVARQQGKEFRMCELYGCTGWDFPLEGHVAIGDWLNVLGINILVPHHFWYQMGGESKRDYPASISPISPYYLAYHVVSDRFDRINREFAGKQEVRNILVINPLESIWFGRPLEAYGKERMINENGFFIHTGAEKYAEMNRVQSVVNELLSRHLDFDFGDEEQMSRLCHVEQNKLLIGKAAYKTVIVPELRTIRATTLNLLTAFAWTGGEVFYFGDAPAFVDGLPDNRAKEAYREFFALTFDSSQLEKYRDVSCSLAGGGEAGSVLYRLSEDDDSKVLELCNTGTEMQEDIHAFPAVCERNITLKNALIKWKLSEEYRVFELDVNSGSKTVVETRRENGLTVFARDFDRLQSRVFIATLKTPANTVKPNTVVPVGAFELKDEAFEYELSEENILVLDHPAWSIQAGHWHEPKYVLHLDTELRGLINLPPRGIMAQQPWFDRSVKAKYLPLTLGYTVCCKKDFEQLRLAIENPEQWQFSLDGMLFKPEDCGCCCDHSMRIVTLPALTAGHHVLELTTRFNKNTSLESIFLLGDFAVKGNDELSKAPLRLKKGDWTKQGFPYYVGNVTYYADFDAQGELLEFDFSDRSGTAFGVSLNGEKERVFVSPPYKCLLATCKGKNRLAFQIYGSRRNALGPFYIRETPYMITPRTFKQYETPVRQLRPYGIDAKEEQ